MRMQWWMLVWLLSTSLARAQWLIPPASYAVTGAPFRASVKSQWDGLAEGEGGESLTLILRDDAGRQRFEQAADDGLQVTLYDPVKAQIVILRPADKTATVRPMARVGQPVTADLSSSTACRAAPGWEELGTATIVGLTACGQKMGARELWLSAAYRMPVKAYNTEPQRGRVKQVIVDFSPGPPDASLFEIPPGYKVTTLPAGGTGMGAGVTPPRVLNAPAPEFSKEAREQRFSGNVLIGLHVGENGLPTNVKVIRGVGHGLDEKAVEAAKRYKFQPAMKDGKPVGVDLRVDINFQNF